MTKEALKKWREEKNLTQEQLAELLKIAPNTVSRWELGTRAIPPYLYLALKTLGNDLSKNK